MSKKKKDSGMDTFAKEQVIVYVLGFIEQPTPENKKQTLKQVHKFGAQYGVNIPRNTVLKPNNLRYLSEFIMNIKGYQESITNLYHSIHNTNDED